MNISYRSSKTAPIPPKPALRILSWIGFTVWIFSAFQQSAYAEPNIFEHRVFKPVTSKAPQTPSEPTKRAQSHNTGFNTPLTTGVTKTDATDSNTVSLDTAGSLDTDTSDTAVLDTTSSQMSSTQQADPVVSKGAEAVQDIVTQEALSKERPLLNGRINELFIGPDGLSLDISVIGGCPGGTYTADLTVLTDSDLNRLLTTLLQAQSQQRVIRLFHHQALCDSKRFDRVSVTPY